MFTLPFFFFVLYIHLCQFSSGCYFLLLNFGAHVNGAHAAASAMSYQCKSKYYLKRNRRIEEANGYCCGEQTNTISDVRCYLQFVLFTLFCCCSALSPLSLARIHNSYIQSTQLIHRYAYIFFLSANSLAASSCVCVCCTCNLYCGPLYPLSPCVSFGVRL